ncbi:MAG: hypothetical protein ACK5JD_01525 [Mangrovibacterium sp.]
MTDLTHYSALSYVFRYPSSERENFSGEWQRIVWERLPELGHKLDLFIVHMQEKTLAEQQEYYIGTFDVQALCFLDIGYVLYGEDYNRGVFLANMKAEQERANNACGTELPDHLPNMLSLLPKISDKSLAEELIVSMMVPALEKMVQAFHPDENVYKGMLEILLGIMQNDFPETEFEKFSFSTQEKAKAFECLPLWRDIK